MFALLAETPSNAVSVYGGWLFAILLATGLLTGVVALLIRGFWAKSGDPFMRQSFKEWYSSKEQQDLRKQEMTSALDAWAIHPETSRTQRAFVRDILDDELRRDDGLIRKEITANVSDLEADLTKRIQEANAPVLVALDKVALQLGKLNQHQQVFQEQMLTRMGRLEGATSGAAQLPRLRGTPPTPILTPQPFPAVKKPPVDPDE